MENKDMIKVDFFSVQVNYSTLFGSYTSNDWKNKATHKVDSGIDAYDFTVEVNTLEEAKFLENTVNFIAEDTYPCNKIATVIWAYIREEEEEV